MTKRPDPHRQVRRRAKRLARTNDKLAARLTELREAEEDHARKLATRALASLKSDTSAGNGARSDDRDRSDQPADGAVGAYARSPGAPTANPLSAAPTPARPPSKRRKPPKPRTRALLIINTKSGPNNDSILRVKEVVERLAAHGIRADVRVKLRKKYARKDAKRAAKDGYPLVIAAGGDGTITAVAEGLLGTDAVLGVIPLGTYNNVATSLGVPTDVEQAIALIASGSVRAADVGLVTATGASRPRIFLEMAAVGLTAAMMPVGSDIKEGRWHSATSSLPTALQMTPTPAEVRLDKCKRAREATTLLIEIANAPRSGPGVITSPDARMDDGQLDVAIYHDHTPAMLAARFVAIKTGLLADDPKIETAQARRVEVRTANPLPVVADSRVVGHTPARFEVRSGCLLVAAGRGIGLAQPPLAAVVEAGMVSAPLGVDEQDPAEVTALGLATPPAQAEKRGPLTAAVDALGKARDAILPALLLAVTLTLASPHVTLAETPPLLSLSVPVTCGDVEIR